MRGDEPGRVGVDDEAPRPVMLMSSSRRLDTLYEFIRRVARRSVRRVAREDDAAHHLVGLDHRLAVAGEEVGDRHGARRALLFQHHLGIERQEEGGMSPMGDASPAMARVATELTQLELDVDLGCLQFITRHRNRFTDQFICIERGADLVALGKHRTYRLDHLAGSVAVRGNVLESVTYLNEVRRRSVQPTEAGIRVRDDRAERLSDFVCNCGRHCRQCRSPRHLRKLVPSLH